ncbi:unnamed protein product [Rhizopus microsporus]
MKCLNSLERLRSSSLSKMGTNKCNHEFRDWRASFENQDNTVTAQNIPYDFFELFAVLAHDSDEPLDTLAERINQILTPFGKKTSESFLKVVKDIIKVTAYQERYGLGDVVLLLEGAPSAIPDRFSFYRWQAHDPTNFPSGIQTAAASRRDERKRFSRELTRAFQCLDTDRQLELLLSIHEPKLRTILKTPSESVADGEPGLFTPFKVNRYTTVAPIVSHSRKRLASNFTTLIYSRLDPSIDLKQRFYNSFSAQSKKKRGYQLNLDIKTALENNDYDKLCQLRMKLLSFHEDVRPAYYGTCSKTSHTVNGKNPFAKDMDLLVYDFDSEPEWDHDVLTDDIYDLVSSDAEFSGLSGLESDSDDQDKEEEVKRDENTPADKWIVPDGYLTDDEDSLNVRSVRRMSVVSRPAKWPMLTSKHFPMNPVILGPSYESTDEPANHPLSDFKLRTLEDKAFLNHPVFHSNTFLEESYDEDTNDMTSSKPLVAICEPQKTYPRFFDKEVDKLTENERFDLIETIVENESKTMMGILGAIRSKKVLRQYTPAQLQAMVHDVAVQEIRDEDKEYKWYLR